MGAALIIPQPAASKANHELDAYQNNPMGGGTREIILKESVLQVVMAISQNKIQLHSLCDIQEYLHSIKSDKQSKKFGQREVHSRGSQRRPRNEPSLLSEAHGGQARSQQ